MTASVSVVIPTLNAGREIGGLLDSLLSQTVVPGEILVVDSSSEDATQGIVSSYADRGGFRSTSSSAPSSTTVRRGTGRL